MNLTGLGQLEQYVVAYLIPAIVLISVILLCFAAYRLFFRRSATKVSPQTTPWSGWRNITIGETLNYRKGPKALRRETTELGKAKVLRFRSTRKHRVMVVLHNGSSRFFRPESDLLRVN